MINANGCCTLLASSSALQQGLVKERFELPFAVEEGADRGMVAYTSNILLLVWVDKGLQGRGLLGYVLTPTTSATTTTLHPKFSQLLPRVLRSVVTSGYMLENRTHICNCAARIIVIRAYDKKPRQMFVEVQTSRMHLRVSVQSPLENYQCCSGSSPFLLTKSHILLA